MRSLSITPLLRPVVPEVNIRIIRSSWPMQRGICAISAGVVVSLLQERYGFAYGMTGTLLSLMLSLIHILGMLWEMKG